MRLNSQYSNIQKNNPIEESIHTQSKNDRTSIEKDCRDTKTPGFFESNGLSFKLSFPKVNLLQQLKAAGSAIGASFLKAGNAISSFSLKESIGKIYLKFQTNVKGGCGPEGVKKVNEGLSFTYDTSDEKDYRIHPHWLNS